MMFQKEHGLISLKKTENIMVAMQSMMITWKKQAIIPCMKYWKIKKSRQGKPI